jgi:glycosyltransferase involved in cell wall biosynthesis
MRTGKQSDDFHMTGALVHNMACGLPLLAARLGGVSEVVKENRNGLLFNPTDMEEFKAKLAQLILNSQDRVRYGVAAAEDARVHFDMRRVTESTVSPLLSLAGIPPLSNRDPHYPPRHMGTPAGLAK